MDNKQAIDELEFALVFCNSISRTVSLGIAKMLIKEEIRPRLIAVSEMLQRNQTRSDDIKIGADEPIDLNGCDAPPITASETTKG